MFIKLEVDFSVKFCYTRSYQVCKKSKAVRTSYAVHKQNNIFCILVPCRYKLSVKEKLISL